MNCPNCSEPFRLCADYASHLQRCRPSDVDPAVTESLLARLNAATASLSLELAAVEAEEAARPQLVA